MTYEPIDFDALKAGRDLDAMIAEKILGYAVQRDEYGNPWFKPDSKWNNWDVVPHYSADLRAAFGLVERFKAQWLQRHGPDDDEPWVWTFQDCFTEGWRADIEWLHHDGNIPITGSRGETLPEAIALTALRVWEEYEGRFEGQEPPDVSDVVPGNPTPF